MVSAIVMRFQVFLMARVLGIRRGESHVQAHESYASSRTTFGNTHGSFIHQREVQHTISQDCATACSWVGYVSSSISQVSGDSGKVSDMEEIDHFIAWTDTWGTF